jgi:hypothetical protein
MFKPKGPFCQSCGMPLSKDKAYISGDYCSNCFKDGKFVLPDITIEEMKERVKGKMKEMHIPGFLANYFTKDIPTLKRWAK